jgi:hypothetical protein
MSARTIREFRAIHVRDEAHKQALAEIAKLTRERDELLVALVLAEHALRKHDREAARAAAKVIEEVSTS